MATALLCASLHAFKAEGLQHAMLGVDTENPSGALRVYEHVGFKPVKRFIQFQKVRGVTPLMWCDAFASADPAACHQLQNQNASLMDRIRTNHVAQLETTTEYGLPEGYSMRGATLDDLPEAVEMFNACSRKLDWGG